MGGELVFYGGDEASAPMLHSKGESTYRRQNGRITDPGLHQQLWRFQCAAAQNHPPCSRYFDGARDTSANDNNAGSYSARPNNTLNPSATLQVEIGAFQGCLHIADDGAAALAVLVVIHRMAEYLRLLSRVCIYVELLIPSIGYQPLFSFYIS